MGYNKDGERNIVDILDFVGDMNELKRDFCDKVDAITRKVVNYFKEDVYEDDD